VALTRKQLTATAFRPLFDEVEGGKKTGNGADEVYRSSWFAYETMAKFIGREVQ
jgi:hypothetical protein